MLVTILLAWFFFVFIADISMKIARLNKKVEKYHDQTQNNLRVRLQAAEERCEPK